MPSHARTVTRTTHRVRNALLVVLLLLVVCAAAAGFSGFKLYKCDERQSAPQQCR